VLVAFTIEFDNEAEHRMAHRTSAGLRHDAPRDAPWLVSQSMWANVLQFVNEEGTRVGDIHARFPGPRATPWPGSDGGGT
jgi:hypothetical protein